MTQPLEESLAAEACALMRGDPRITQADFASLQADVRAVVGSYAARCRGLDEEELASFLTFEGGVALLTYARSDRSCEPGAYVGTAIRRRAGTYVHRMRTAASFTGWDLREHYEHLVRNNQLARAVAPSEDPDQPDLVERLPAPDPSNGLMDAALARVCEIVGRVPAAARVLLGQERPGDVAPAEGLSAAQMRLATAIVRTELARDQTLRELVRLLGVTLARDPAKPWTLACVSVSTGAELPVDWARPPEFASPEEARRAAVALERAYYARDPDAIEVEYLVRRASGVETP